MQIGLKERLIGAAVLVILAVIIIPWVLKGGSAPSTTVNQSLALPQATTAPAAQTTYHLPLTSAMDTSSDSAAAATQHTAPTAASRPPAAPIVQPPAAASPAVKPAAPSARVAESGKWAVQAGSYASQRNALAVEHKLVKRGFHAYISRYRKSGRTYYRVRVGPYSERAAAERAVNGVARAYGGHAEVVANG